MIKLPKTTRGLMILTAVIASLLGIAINLQPYLPLLLVIAIVLSPQIIVVAICSVLAARERTPQPVRCQTPKLSVLAPARRRPPASARDPSIRPG